MTSQEQKPESPAATFCLCNALRQATRAVSRLYDEELRRAGLRTTQYSLLRRLRGAGEITWASDGLAGICFTSVPRVHKEKLEAWLAERNDADVFGTVMRGSDSWSSED